MKRIMYFYRHEVTLCMFLLYLLLFRHYPVTVVFALTALYTNALLSCIGMFEPFRRVMRFYLYKSQDNFSKIPVFVEKSIDSFLTIFNIVSCIVFYNTNYSLFVLLLVSFTEVIILSIKVSLNYIKF